MSGQLTDLEKVKESLDKAEKQEVIQQDGPHDSAYVYSQLKGKHTEAVFPTLEPKEKPGIGKTLAIVGLLFMVMMGGWGTAYEIQIILAPHVIGICPSPAIIESGGCFTSQTSVDQQGNSHTVLIPAGHIQGGP